MIKIPLNKRLVGFFCFFCLGFSVSVYSHSFILENTDIDESSGLARSSRYPDVFWTHNDSGNAAVIYAFDHKGRDLGAYFLGGEAPSDWEDMAAFTYEGKHYLLLADTGDNKKIHFGGHISVFEEPDIKQYQGIIKEPTWQFDFIYPKFKSHDVESVAVDIKQKTIYLISKRKKKAHLYSLPLHPQQQTVNATKLNHLPYLKRPTSMDISADGRYAVVLVYGKVYWFYRKNGNSWNTTLQHPQITQPYHGLKQPEGICFGNSVQEVYISSEQLPAKVKKIRIPDQ